MEEVRITAQSKFRNGYQAIFVELYSEKAGQGKTFSKLYEGGGISIAQHTAIIEGLGLLKKKCKIHLRTDAQKFVTAFNKGYFDKWAKNGFNKPKNLKELYRTIHQLLNGHMLVVEHLSSVQRDKLGDSYIENALRYKEQKHYNGISQNIKDLPA